MKRIRELNPMAESFVPESKQLRSKYFQDAMAQKRYYGIKRNIGYRRKYPLGQFWDAPMQRGSAQSLELVGPSYKLANDIQKRNRKSWLMSGRGKYMTGRGGFFGGLAGLLSGQGWKAGSDMGDKVWDTVKVPATAIASSMGVPLAQIMAASDVANKVAQPIAEIAGKGMYSKRRMLGQGLYRGSGLYKGRGTYATNHIITDGGATASAVVPRFSQSDVTEITLSNREYVKDIYAPSSLNSFQVQTWSLNPGLPDSFPWLAQLAINFEEYEIVQLIYTFKSTVADFASASGQVGQVVMATQYNPNSDAFADKEEMMLHDGGMSCKTTESLVHGIECDPSKNAGASQKYVRVGNLPTTEDLKNYDLGKTSIAVINCPATYQGQQLGELWVSYTIKLRKPKFASGNAYNIRRDVFCVGPYAATQLGGIPLTQTVLFGSRNSLGSSFTIADADNLEYMPAGLYPNGVSTDLALQNTVTQIPASTTYTWSLTLPNSYSGIIALSFTVRTGATGAVIPNIGLSNANTMKRFKDIALGYTGTPTTSIGFTPSWSHYKLDVYDSDQQGTCQVELHLRILPASDGVENIIYVHHGSASANPATVTIDLHQINSFLSYADNGSNDKIDLLSSLTLQRAIWA